MDEKFHQLLLASDNFAQCSLRATFFVRSLRGLRLWEVIHEVHALLNLSEGFAWKDRDKWGIEPDAWDFIARRAINPLLIFCHPRVISEQPRLLLYYRTATMLSQKGLRSMIGGDIARAESGKCERLEPAWINKLVITLNSIASAIIASSADIEADQLPGFQFATAGTTIQGAWNNAIGTEGEVTVKTILLSHLKREIAQIVWRDNTTAEYHEELHPALIDRIQEIRVVRLRQGYHLLFSNNPIFRSATLTTFRSWRSKSRRGPILLPHWSGWGRR